MADSNTAGAEGEIIDDSGGSLRTDPPQQIRRSASQWLRARRRCGELEVEDFPVIVANDAHGGDLYEEGQKKYRRE